MSDRVTGTFCAVSAVPSYWADEEPTVRVNAVCNVRRHLWACESRADFEESTIPIGTINGQRCGICLACGAELKIPSRRR